ncbi:MAG TPA: glycosyltransferase [Patescibacteria group bacterium]|nr:glycosyltransferase [Patescibacteria group bacterium]
MSESTMKAPAAASVFDNPLQAPDRRLLRYIPPDAALVLDVGCGSGVNGACYKSINPHGRYWGLERDPEQARQAACRLDAVWCGDPAGLNLNSLAIPSAGLQCLVYAGELERVTNPQGLLCRQTELLAADGVVVATFQNAAHWRTLGGLLLNEKFCLEEKCNERYLPAFTAGGIRELFSRAGLTVIRLEAEEERGAEFERLLRELQPMMLSRGIKESDFAARLAARRFIVQAVKPEAAVRPLLVQSLLGETLVCSRVRISEPGQFIASIPGVRTEENQGNVSLYPSSEHQDKVFIWQRTWPSFPAEIYKQKALVDRGYLIVAEIDDDPLRWKEYHESNQFFAFRGCHGIQTSTEPLAEYLRRWNPNVAVFPNQLAVLPALRPAVDSEPVWLFFGALNREDDWAPLMPVLNDVLSRYGEKIRVRVAHDRQFYEALTTSYKTFVQFCPYETYQRLLYSTDINLLPLLPNRFNSMKSDLKFIESAAYGAVALASPTVYSGTVEHGVTGFIYHSPEEFGRYLSMLIENPELRRTVQTTAYAWVRDRRLLSGHYRQRVEWYRTMLARLTELNQELRQRVPELFASGERL